MTNEQGREGDLKQNGCDVTTEQAISEFMIEQRIRGNTEKTLDYYKYVFHKFEAFRRCDKISDITLQLCKEYLLYLMCLDISSVTVQSYVRGFRAFLSWLYASGYHSVNLSNAFRLPKAHKAVINVLTRSEIDLLLSQFCFILERFNIIKSSISSTCGNGGKPYNALKNSCGKPCGKLVVRLWEGLRGIYERMTIIEVV